MSGGFFRGTSADQDTRFSNKQAKLLKTQKFASELEHLVDITKVKMDVMKPWIANRVTELLGFEDEVLINFIYGLLDGKVVNGKEVQIQLTGFMEKNTGKFMKELWTLLLSAQNNASGVPQQFLDAKEEETRKKKAEADRIANEIQRKKEKESRERNQQSLKKTAGAVEKKGNSATWEPNSNTNVAGALSSRLEDEKEGGERNGVRGRNRLSGSPQSVVHSPSSQRVSPSRSISKSYSNSRSYSNDRCKSRSLSRSLEARRPSISSDRVCRTSKRRSITPRSRHSPWTSRSPSRRRLSYYRRRSRSHSPRRSPSPLRRRLHSPFHRRSPLSPPGRSPSPVRHRRSPSLVRRRRSPSPIYRRRSPSPARRRRSPSPARRRRSPSPIRRRRSPSPARRRRSPSPIRRRRSPSPIRRRRSPSPIRRRRSPSPIRRRRSPSPIQDRRSPSPIRRRRSPSPILHRRSPSPLRRRSPSPVQRQAVSLVNCMSPAPGCRKTPSPVQRAHRRSTSTSEHRSSSSMRYRSPMPQRRRSPTALKLRSPSYRSSSPSPTRRRSPSPDVKRRRSPVHSARVSSRSGEIFSPAARQPSSSFRAAQGDPGDQRETRAKAPPLSPSAERSPSVESPPHATRKRRSAGDQRSESPYESPVRQPKNLSVRGGSISPRPMSRGRKQHQDGLKTSKVNIESNHASERFSERAISGSSNQLTSPPLYKDARRGEKQLLSCHGERKESDERDHSRSDNGKESSEFCKPESATKVVEKDDLNSRSEASDSESGGQNRHRSEVKEKRRHKRYRKEEVASDDVNSSDSEIERKHSKKRRKEEKRLRKEDKRRRREERRRRREERRAEKRKLKNNNADTSDCDDLHRRKSHAKEDEETEQRRLEIELRKKALESIKAKKNSNR